MPIYEYHCRNCKHHFDLMQKISDAPVTQCPVCLEQTAEKLISAPGFQLKGAGWYETDFKGKKPSSTGGADAKAETKTPSSGGSDSSKGDKA